ncbi:hypothetical protein Drose_34450 [Dactylosporangium roseum]|uniref:HIT-type domain-containing protein n=2 Tax=Dactylosporangium roseum TaxID=47989 RepID=A0ABY5Z4Y3_9ACTN|nr:hypothetical protein [Dactylosporangium roseum]UWZ36094.1 hypothetical protein Drose_34350 [Dactylosporangium roseum]UWZ36103.1 hypothetical protein Drose_34400 [Dactylosporangium roseum]UWZ36112.1 hypothetical protein Drose_34450 [Dactylosporangium roseum]
MSTRLDWRRNHVNWNPKPCHICGRPALMCDERDVPCHLVCAQAEADAPTDQSSNGDAPLAVVVDLPIPPVVDLSTRRRIA